MPSMHFTTTGRRLDLRHLVAWFLIGVVVALLLQWLQVRAVGGDWTGLVNTGRQSALRPLIEAELGPVSTVEQAGHDGQFSYLIAVDPLGRGEAPNLFDHGAYRYRRILLPALAGGFGLWDGEGALAGLIVWSAIGMGLATAAVADLGASFGTRPWVVAGVLANPGVWLSVQLLTPDVLALGLALTGVALWSRASSSLGRGRSGPGGPRQGPVPVGGVWAGRVGVVPGESTGGGPGCRPGCRSAGDLVDLADGHHGRRTHSAGQLLGAVWGHLGRGGRMDGHKCQGPHVLAHRRGRFAAGNHRPFLRAIGSVAVAHLAVGGSGRDLIDLGLGFGQQLPAGLRPTDRIRRVGGRRASSAGRTNVTRTPIPDRVGRSLPWMTLGILVALVASVMPLSHDEAFWLAITRQVEAGARLYDGAIDNKPPLVYLVVYLLDHVPGSFQVARGLLVGGLIGWIGLLSALVGRLRGCPRATGVTVGLVAAVAVALQTEFVFTVELPALTALLSCILLIFRRRALPAALMVALSAAFDPRTLLLVPGLVLLAVNQSGWPVARRFGLWTGGLAVLGVGIVLIQPELRYGLIELNLGSRASAGGWRPAAQLAVAFRSLLPLLVGGLFLRPATASLRSRAFVWMAAGSLALGFLSVLPFDHYWAYAVMPLVLLGSGADERTLRFKPAMAAVVVTLAFSPLIINAVTTAREQRDVTADYAEAATILGAQLQESDQFVSFDIKPYMAAELPDPYALRSPVSGYLVWPTSRSQNYLDELPSLIDDSVAISEDGGLKVDRAVVSDEYRPVWDLFQERLGDFPCVVETGRVILRFRSERCPAP